MTTPSAPFSSPERVLELRALYESRFAATAASLVTQKRAAVRSTLPGCLTMVAGIGAGVWVLASHEWPAGEWWRDPASLLKIGIALAGALLAHRIGNRLAAPGAARAESAEEKFRQAVLGPMFPALRPGAKYNPSGAVGHEWTRRSALVRTPTARRDEEHYRSRHEVRWKRGESAARLAEARVESHTPGDHDTHSSTTVLFDGFAAIVDLPVSAPGHVRIRAADTMFGTPPDAPSLVPVPGDRFGLAGTHDVRASSAGAAAMVLSAGAVDLLRRVAAERQGVHVAVAHQQLFVLFELRRSWFDGLVNHFGVEEFLWMAETLDVVDAISDEVVGALRASGR